MSIKPTKNTYYCPACGKTKMLFQSEKEAQTFLRYNQEEIEECNGKAPVRAYYCDMCLGWHLSSQRRAYKVSSSELMQLKLHIDAAHELNRFKVFTEEIEQMHKEKSYGQILAPGLSLMKKMARVKLFSKESQEKKQEIFRIVTDSFQKEMERLTKMMLSGDYLLANEQLNTVISLLDSIKGIKLEALTNIRRDCIPNVTRIQALYRRREQNATLKMERDELISLKSDFCGIVSQKKLGKIKHHDRAISIFKRILEVEDNLLFKPREEMLRELRSFIMDNIMAYMQEVDVLLLDGHLEDATIMMDELNVKIRESYTLDDFQLLRDFYYQTLILITRRKMKIEVAYIDKEKKHKHK